MRNGVLAFAGAGDEGVVPTGGRPGEVAIFGVGGGAGLDGGRAESRSKGCLVG